MTSPRAPLFVCHAIETTGLQSSAAVVEFGWAIVDPLKEATESFGIQTIRPPASLQWEPEAYRIHQSSGLVKECVDGGELRATIASATAARMSEGPRPKYDVWYQKDFSRKLLEDDFPGLFRYRSLDFHTLNVALEVFTGNEAERPAGHRALHKIIVMASVLRKLTGLFHLATLYPKDPSK